MCVCGKLKEFFISSLFDCILTAIVLHILEQYLFVAVLGIIVGVGWEYFVV